MPRRADERAGVAQGTAVDREGLFVWSQEGLMLAQKIF
jgi:hypothetical protein